MKDKLFVSDEKIPAAPAEKSTISQVDNISSNIIVCILVIPVKNESYVTCVTYVSIIT